MLNFEFQIDALHLKKMSDTKEFRLALKQIKSYPFYWGKIDTKTAEAILEDQPNGSYLLKDPEEEGYHMEFVCKVNSKYRHYFFISNFYHISALMEFNEHPVLRKKPFSLLELAKNEIRNTGIKDEDISKLEIPKTVQTFLKDR